jgi:hypothetical protein
MYWVRFYYLIFSSKSEGVLSNTPVITKSNSYFWALNWAMRKVSNVLLCGLVLLMACNKETPGIPPLPPNQDVPSLDFEFVSVASTVKFIPFGDTLLNTAVNKGYELQLSDTNESVVMACPGIISSIVPDTTLSGGSLITVKFKRNSIYSFTYGGVSRVVVNVNDSLSGGKILGKVSGTGLVDFEVITNNNEALCPETFGSPGFNQAIQEAILKSNQFNPYDTINYPCRVQSLPK